MKLNKNEFVEKLGELLSVAEVGVRKLTYDEETEFVTVHYNNGYTRQANVAADSHIAIIVDVLKVVYR